jgi:hypothetical protein
MRSGALMAVALLAVVTSPVLAQEDLPVNGLIKTVERAAFGKQTGHDKCNGGGHQGSGGSGHEDGECDQEQPQPTGPVSDAICTATLDVESAWSRYSCEVSANVETYSGEARIYAEESATSVISYVDGGRDLLGTPPLPQPQVLPDPESALRYTTSYIDQTRLYAEESATSVISYVDGGRDLLGTPPLPQPQVLPDPESALRYTTSYIDQTRLYAEQSATSVIGYADGGRDLLGTPPLPQPQVVPDPTSMLEEQLGQR